MKKESTEDIEFNLTGSETDHPIAVEASKPKWYKRSRKGITTSTADKKETPEGLWNKCPECNEDLRLITEGTNVYWIHDDADLANNPECFLRSVAE